MLVGIARAGVGAGEVTGEREEEVLSGEGGRMLGVREWVVRVRRLVIESEGGALGWELVGGQGSGGVVVGL